MPTVPMYQRQVAPAPLPTVRGEPNAAAPAFATAQPVDLSGVAHIATQLHDEATAQADQIAVSDADARLVRAKTKWLWSPDQGAMNARGKDAIPVSDAAQAGFQQDAKAIEESLQTDRQKEAFRRRVDMHYADLGGQLGQHVSSQIRQYDADTTNGHLDALGSAAIASYQDPASVQRSVDDTKAVMTDYWRRNGHGDGPNGVDAYAQQQIAGRVSAIHASIFEQYSNAGQDRAAFDYFHAHKDELTPADRATVEPIADAGRVRADGQEQAATILGKVTSLPEALDAASKIEDPEVRADVTKRVEQHYADIATGLLRTRQENYAKASKIIEDTGGNMDAVPLSIRRTLLPGENEALQHRADQIRHPKQFGDSESYYHLKNLAHISDESRREFLKENVATGYPNLSDQQRSSLIALQASVRAQMHRTGADKGATTPPAAGVTPPVAAAPVAPAKPYNPLAGMLTPESEPTIKPTRQMIDDIAKKGPGYAKYLRAHGVDVPLVLLHQPATP